MKIKWQNFLVHLLDVAYDVATERRDLTEAEMNAYLADSSMFADSIRMDEAAAEKTAEFIMSLTK